MEVAGPLAVPQGPEDAAFAAVCVTVPALTKPKAKRTTNNTARNAAFRCTSYTSKGRLEVAVSACPDAPNLGGKASEQAEAGVLSDGADGTHVGSDARQRDPSFE
jgi:hypothetical protein